MSLTLHNTRTRQKEAFVPLREGEVTMYVCGPTVYSFPHIGNARPAVVFDVLARLLRTRYRLTYARNITDIDDKINKAAAEQGVPIGDIAAALRGRLPGGHGGTGRPAAGPGAPCHGPRAGHHRHDCAAHPGRACLRRRGTRVCSGCALTPTTAHCRAVTGATCWRAPASRWRPTRRMRAISCCGSRPRPTCPAGRARGDGAGPAGTSSAQR